MTCNDCIHYDACRNLLELFDPKYKDKNLTFTKSCGKFKNKTDFVEVVTGYPPKSLGGEKRGEWIDVNKELPTTDSITASRVLAYVDTNQPYMGVFWYYGDDKWEDYETIGSAADYGITHWMPLPKPPEKKG